jgi:hypothetical protein
MRDAAGPAGWLAGYNIAAAADCIAYRGRAIHLTGFPVRPAAPVPALPCCLQASQDLGKATGKMGSLDLGKGGAGRAVLSSMR